MKKPRAIWIILGPSVILLFMNLNDIYLYWEGSTDRDKAILTAFLIFFILTILFIIQKVKR